MAEGTQDTVRHDIVSLCLGNLMSETDCEAFVKEYDEHETDCGVSTEEAQRLIENSRLYMMRLKARRHHERDRDWWAVRRRTDTKMMNSNKTEAVQRKTEKGETLEGGSKKGKKKKRKSPNKKKRNRNKKQKENVGAIGRPAE